MGSIVKRATVSELCRSRFEFQLCYRKAACPRASYLTSLGTESFICLMGGSLSLFRADWMRGRVESTQQTLAHGVQATIHSVNIYWASTACRFCSSHGGSATKGRSKSPLLTFTYPRQDFSRALKTHANETKAMIFKSHHEMHQELHFQVRVSLQLWGLSSRAQRQWGSEWLGLFTWETKCRQREQPPPWPSGFGQK